MTSLSGVHPSWESITVAAGLAATMAAYAIFTGADFGGGIWDLLAGSTERGRRPRAEIDKSVTPVWEGNQTWIVLGIVLLWTGFPSAFAAVTTTLFIPLALALLGLVLRGVGFAFRHESEHVRTEQLNGALFAGSSLLSPFFLGVAVGAVATGRVHSDSHGNVLSAWVTPTALMTGALFVCACAYIGGLYLIGDAHQRDDEEMVRYFSVRSLAAAAVTGALAAANLGLLHGSAPYIWHRLFGAALPLVILSMVCGLVTVGLIVLRRVWALRFTGALAVASVVAAWAWAQYPWVLPGSMTLASASAPAASLAAEIAVLGMAALLVVPSFAYLYWLQQHDRLSETSPSEELRNAAAAENRATVAARPAPKGHSVVAAVAVGAALIDLVRDVRSNSRRRRRR